MPIEKKTEIETRFKEFTDVLRKSGAHLIELENGKTIEEAINDLKEGIGKKSLNEEVPPAIDAVTIEKYELLEQRMNDLEDKLANMGVGGVDIDLKKEFPSELLIEKTDLKLDEKKSAVTPALLNKALKLKTDSIKKGEKLVEDFPYPSGRTTEIVNPPRTIVDWLRPKSDSSKFIFSGRTVDNSFDTANPVQDGKVQKGVAKKSAPTGGGKSTLLLRCGAFHALDNEEIKTMSSEERKKLGVTLVVPEKSLTGSVLSGHDDWLSDEAAVLESIEKMRQRIANGEKKSNGELYTEDDIDDRVIKCPFCGKKHTEVDGKPYETVENGPSNMINVFYWADFLDAYVNNPGVIKPWVYFDEAHLKVPVCYKTLIDCMIGDNQTGKALHSSIRKDQFSVLALSATFPDLPTSIQLTSKYVKDYYVKDFKGMTELKNFDDKSKVRHQNIFKRKLLIFVDKPEKDEKDGTPILWRTPTEGEKGKKFDKIDVEALEKKAKVIIANDALRPYITDIIKALEPPLGFVLSSAYEMGFSFGDVDCITTGYVTITVVVEEKGKLVEKEIEVSAEFYNWLQQRGRVGRDQAYVEPVWMSITKESKNYDQTELNRDIPSQLLIKEFEKKGGVSQIDKKVIERIVDFYKADKPIPELDAEEGKRYLYIMLIKDLKNKLGSASKLFNVTKEEKEKVEEKRKFLKSKLKKPATKEAEKAKIRAALELLKVRESGEYIFESEMMRYFQEDDLQKILIEATSGKLKQLREKSEKDDYVFDSSEKADAMMCGFLLSCRDKTKYEVKVTQNTKGQNVKLSIKFKPYQGIKEGAKLQRGLEIPNEVVYEVEKEEVWREAIFEIPPKDRVGW